LTRGNFSFLGLFLSHSETVSSQIEQLDQPVRMGASLLIGSDNPMYNNIMNDFAQSPRQLNNARASQEPIAAPRVHVVATGGTIAMQLDPDQGGATPAVSGADLVAIVPGISQIARLSVEEFSNIPSEHMTPDIWLRLATRLDEISRGGDVEGIVITHGTDTMEETAFFLDLAVGGDISIVLTGAQRPASAPDADGPGNLRDAIRVAGCAESRGRGVMIVMHGEIHTAREAVKTYTEELDAFDSHSGTDLGIVQDDRIFFTSEVLPRRHLSLPTSLPRVDIIPMYAGADDAALQAALEHEATGLVIAAVGAGNVNRALFDGIKTALQQGVAVVIATRVPHGLVRPLYAYAGGGVSLREAGAIMAGDLTPQKARVLLMLALAAGEQGESLRERFEAPDH
jgi:L-asparaginase